MSKCSPLSQTESLVNLEKSIMFSITLHVHNCDTGKKWGIQPFSPEKKKKVATKIKVLWSWPTRGFNKC